MEKSVTILRSFLLTSEAIETPGKSKVIVNSRKIATRIVCGLVFFNVNCGYQLELEICVHVLTFFRLLLDSSNLFILLSFG
ncbi:ABC-type histidine transport system, ATPase component [Candidatus Scalindua japonica]|uniref:ABC-type histidine transport system, ATPase component n=1 Tax=Candidatus Scalindua japonica TaxID=1284222 RepID=A0A286TYQ9_9BACT|nr:ABC-type histidine transport system, ATPase component [Candidatus Scalindua japonica]